MQTFRWLEESQAPWPQFWHDWHGGAEQKTRALSGPNKAHYSGGDFDEWFEVFSGFETLGAPPETDKPASLIYEEIGELWDPIDKDDDWSLFEEKLATFKQP